ncbi:MAG: hypothetical protein M3391_08360 [Actinomycetota bacterium]|nr:hypothetical protein [Actinomycetota bacterium]
MAHIRRLKRKKTKDGKPIFVFQVRYIDLDHRERAKNSPTRQASRRPKTSITRRGRPMALLASREIIRCLKRYIARKSTGACERISLRSPRLDIYRNVPGNFSFVLPPVSALFVMDWLLQ